MVKLRKKEIKDGIIYYYYQKEGKGKWGLLYYNPDKKERGFVNLAEGDIENDGTYRNHAVYRIKEYIEKNNFPEKDTVAWY